MKITYLIGFLLLPILIFGQNLKSELKNEQNKIDSIVNLINRTEKQYSEGIAEGPIIYKNIFRKNGGWEAYYLNKEDENFPLRIKYNEAGYKTYKTFEFYYDNGELIFAELNVDFYRGKRKNKPVEIKYYFKNSKLISKSNPELEKHGTDYIQLTEQSVRKILYE